MEEKEKQILKEIDSLHEQLKQEPDGSWKGKVYIEPSCFRYCNLADQLKDKVVELRDDKDITADYANVLNQHINSLYESREIQYVKQSISNNDIEQVSNLMKKANQHLETLFVAVFQKIDELKQLGELP